MKTTSGLRAVLTACVVALLSACSGVEEKRHEYRQSESIAPLKMPANVAQPYSPEQLMVPEVSKDVLGEEPFDTRPPVNLPPQEEAVEESEQ